MNTHTRPYLYSTLTKWGLFLAVALCFAPQVTQAENILQDGDMEAPIENTAWITYGTPSVFEKSSEQIFEGSQSLHVKGNEETGRGGFQQLNIPVEAGKTYRLSLQYYLIEGSFKTWVGIKTSNGAYDGRVDAVSTHGSWKLYTREFTVPNDFTTDFRYMISMQSGEGFIDAVEIVEIEDSNLVEDGDMEEQNLYVWSSYRTPSTREKVSDAHTGAQAIHFTTPRIDGQIRNLTGIQQRDISVEAGKTYTFRFSYRVSGSLLPILAIANSDTDYELALEPGVAPILNTTDEWTTYERTFTVPSDYTNDFRVVFILFDIESSADWQEVTQLPQGEAFVDDVEIVLAEGQDQSNQEEIVEEENNSGSSDESGPRRSSRRTNSNPTPVPTNFNLLQIRTSTVIINGGNLETTTRTVALHIDIEGAAEMAVSESADINQVYTPFASSTSWELSPEAGEKIIYIHLRSTEGNTLTLTRKINLIVPELPTEVGGHPLPPSTEEIEPEKDCILPVRKIYETEKNKKYYVTSQCTRKEFLNEEVFLSYRSRFPLWQSVSTIEIESIKKDSDYSMPLGPDYTVKTGDLLKLPDDPKVYLIVENKRYWISSEKVFFELGHSWDKVKTVNREVLDLLEEGIIG